MVLLKPERRIRGLACRLGQCSGCSGATYPGDALEPLNLVDRAFVASGICRQCGQQGGMVPVDRVAHPLHGADAPVKA